MQDGDRDRGDRLAEDSREAKGSMPCLGNWGTGRVELIPQPRAL